MQTVCVYIGYVICGIGYWRSPEGKNKERENKSPLWKFMIPATSGVLGSVFISMGYNFLSPSTVLLFRSGNLLAVMVFSKLLMSLKIQRHQWVGSSISIVGLFFVGFADFYFDEQSTENVPSKLCRTKLSGTLWWPFPQYVMGSWIRTSKKCTESIKSQFPR